MKPRTAARISIGVSLLVVILTIVLDIFPYFVIGIISLLLAIVVVVEAVREYFRAPSLSIPERPANWNSLVEENLPVASAEKIEHAKERFAASHDVHGKCPPRNGPYGLIENPLSMDD
jgi:hypothetical protein